MASYIILNDGTKWRVPNTNVNVGSGPYRAYSTSPDPVKPAAQKGTVKANTGKTNAVQQVTAGKSAAQIKAEEDARLRREKQQQLEKYRDEERERIGKGYARQKLNAKLASDENMRQLYIAYMNKAKGIPQQAAIKGNDGDIETLKYQNKINYEDNRAKESRSHQSILAQLEEQYNQDLLTLENKYLAQLMKL